MSVREKLELNMDRIIEELTNCETIQNSHESDYSKDRAKINTYDYIIELLGVKGAEDETVI